MGKILTKNFCEVDIPAREPGRGLKSPSARPDVIVPGVKAASAAFPDRP
jgi:hypothetical protein